MLLKCICVLDLASFAALNDSPTYACQAADSSDAERFTSSAHTVDRCTLASQSKQFRKIRTQSVITKANVNAAGCLKKTQYYPSR